MVFLTLKEDYEINGKELTRTFIHESGTIEKAKILYEKECEMIFITDTADDGGVAVITEKGSYSPGKNKIKKAIYLKNKNEFHHYSIKPELIEKWKNILKV